MPILEEGRGTVPTIENALQLVGREGDSFETWRLKGLGLRLVLMGLAEVQALRLSRLAGMVFMLEKELLDEERIRSMDPRSLFSLYTVSTRALNDSSEFVERTLKTMDWNTLESDLLQAKAATQTEDGQGIDPADAQAMLADWGRLIAEHERDRGRDE